jgi:sugar/nucleoside kinase (ribokinase family)
MPEIIAVGEILVEIMRPSLGQPLDQPGEFEGPFPSGAPAIFSVAASRLGLDVGIIGAVGEDAFGRMMRSCFDVEKVDSSQLQILSGHSTGAAFIAYDQSGDREFVFYIRHAAAGALSTSQIQEKYFEKVKWLYISGSSIFINESSRAACQKALDLTLASNGRVSIDPNLRPELMPLEQSRTLLMPFLAAADLILPSSSEACAITGKESDDLAVHALTQKKTAIVVVKKGSRGCSIYSNGERLDVPGSPVVEVDPTGAGDCFSAAFIAGLEAGLSLEECGHFANAAGALAVTKKGPMEGAPMLGQVHNLMNRGELKLEN